MGSTEYAVANGYLNYHHWMLGMKCLWQARLEETTCWLYSTILVGMMNIKVLDGLAASEHTGEFTEGKKKQNDKLRAFISQQISSFENYKASTIAKENLLSLRATEPIQLESQTSHWTLPVAEL